MRVGLRPKGEMLSCEFVHILIGKTFIKNPHNKKEINHKDGNPLNNYYKNLEWNTRKENYDHARYVLKRPSGHYQCVIDMETGAFFESIRECYNYKKPLITYGDLQGYDRQQLNLYCNYDKPRCDLSGNFSIDADGDYVLTFGKNKGQKAKNCRDYLMWMLGGSFMPDTKALINKILN